ncbi:MAG: hypothetical protein IPG99_12085 [Ignavibacteria bacterium]|nr:hypothetical protein [Ignavibacteria bacterium]
MTIFKSSIVLIVTAILLLSCKDKDQSGKDKNPADSISESSHEKEIENSSMVFLTNEQINAIKIEYGSIEKNN